MCEWVLLLLILIGIVKKEESRRRPLRTRSEQWNSVKPTPPSPVARWEQPPRDEPAGDAHAGGPYASFYPEDDLGGWQGRGRWEEEDCWQDESYWDDEPEYQNDEIDLLDWLIVLDE